MASYIYSRVSEAFIRSLEESALAGSNGLLVGPRYGGKRGTLQELNSRLRTQNKNTPVCFVELTDHDVATESDLCRLLFEKMPTRVGSTLPSSLRIEDLFAQLTERVILLASNADVIAQPVAEQFLRVIESSIEENRLVAFLTAEGDVRELLGGIKHEFRVAQRYFLQGYDEQKFGERVRTFLSQRLSWFRMALAKGVQLDDESLNLLLDDKSLQSMLDDDSLRLLFAETGGNAYLARLLLSRVLGFTTEQHTGKNKRSGPVLMNKELLVEEVELLKGSLTWRDPLVVHAVVQINQDSSCCRNLEDLLRQDRFEVPAPEASLGPTTLELAGVAVRLVGDVSPSHQTNDSKVALGFASPLMQSFMRSHFDKIRLGDLYVQGGDWNRAVECYESAPMHERIRPRNTYDRVRADNVIRNLCAELHLSATQGSEGSPVRRVDNLFADCCRYVLGFREVSLFLWKPNEPTKTWRDITASILAGSCDGQGKSRVELEPDRKRKIIEALPEGGALPDGILEITPFRSFTVAVAIKGIHPGERVVIALTDFDNHASVSPTRRRLVADLIEHYVKARENAGDIEADRLRMYVLEKYHDINRFIGERLQAQRMDVDGVLEFVARKIMELGYGIFGVGYYSRSKGEVICGVYRYKAKHRYFSRHKEWPNPRLAREVLETASDGNARKVLDDDGRALWIIPLRPRAAGKVKSDVTHILVVQRGDFAEISEQERKDLTDFGRQLLEAIQESERIILLQSTLKHMTEPVVVIDADRKLRYANSAMSKLFGLKGDASSSALKAPRIERALKGTAAKRVSALLLESLEADKSLSEQLLDGLGNTSPYYGRMRSGSIHNSRNRPIGAYLHVQGLLEYSELLECIKQLFNTPTVEGLYTVLLTIGPNRGWRRLYRTDSRDPNTLTGVAASGPQSEEKELFVQGKQPVTKTPGGESAWFCLDRDEPVLFEYTKETGDRRTKYLVPVESVASPPWRGLLKKLPGELWLDVPLIGRTQVGKISMQCDDEVQPEHIEYWRVIGGAAALALENLEREAQERQTAALAAERVFLASMAHNLHTRIASLEPITTRYELHAQRNPSSKLAEINQQMRHTLAMLQEVFGKVLRHLGTLRIEPTAFDLAHNLRRLIAERGLSEVARVTSQPESIVLTADEHLMEGLFSELLQNSKDILNPSDVLAIDIEMRSFVTNGREWLRINYRDKGPGVSIEKKKKIFDLFFTHRTNGTVGTGLGLYFANRVVLAHGGTIAEKGVGGEGASFIIEIPVVSLFPGRS